MARGSMFSAWYHLLTNPFRSNRRRHSLPLTSLDPRRGRTSGAWTSTGQAQKHLSSSSHGNQPPLLPTKLIMPSTEILTPPVSPIKQHARWLSQSNDDAEAAPQTPSPANVHPVDVSVVSQAALPETARIPPPRPPRSPVTQATLFTPSPPPVGPVSKPGSSSTAARTMPVRSVKDNYVGPTHPGIGSVQGIVDPESIRPVRRAGTDPIAPVSLSPLSRSVSVASPGSVRSVRSGLSRAGSKRGNPLAMNPVEGLARMSEDTQEGEKGDRTWR